MTLASWCASPIGGFLAREFNLGSNRYLLLSLIAVGMAAPFKLIINETISPVWSKFNKRPRWVFFGFGGCVQFGVSIFALTHFSSEPCTLPLAAYLGALSIADTALSLISAKIFLDGITKGAITHVGSVVTGLAPGLTQIIIYISVIALHAFGLEFGGAFTLILVLPALAQALFLVFTKGPGRWFHTAPTPIDIKGLAVGPLLLLLVMSPIGTLERSRIAVSSGEDAALMIIFANFLLTVVLTLSKGRFLFKPITSRRATAPFTAYLAICVVLLWGGAMAFTNVVASFGLLFATQMLVGATIIFYRGMLATTV